ncbi:hypothetical protein CO178_00020 [candidate division WWE3 bacterium CG_4_9_14_3_um_filter_34_6]|uniref:Polyprenyl synthetase n=1 Tax=candidate division WWE3 bacterium CG_4_9_14_3_um_filter_34_6 TaxID=1975079 RepID=A0A2M7X5P8_UNCKA|nr:MAG: hypothetical protein CO178_00020 [candidate division WWE3 bacterium CG_4_9_14_3_um_filter_34_6]
MGEELYPTKLVNQLAVNIYEPTVQVFYDEFVKHGCVTRCEELYEYVGNTEAVEIIQKVQSSQVNREKAMWPVYLARGRNLDVDRAVRIGSSVDVLWSLSVIMDDIEDGDRVRAGVDSLWARLGIHKATEIAQLGLKGVTSYLKTTVGKQASELAYQYVMNGMKSLKLHRELGLCADYRNIIKNYWMRDDFHSAFPFHALYRDIKLPETRELIFSFRKFNQAGQVLNDLADFKAQRNQTYRLSDLQGGRNSIALKLLYEMADADKRLLIEKCFGQAELSDIDAYAIMELASGDTFVNRLSLYVGQLYRMAQNTIGEYFLPEDREKLELWVNYKLRKLK